MMPVAHLLCSDAWRRLLAASAAGLVLLLAVLAASPALHEVLHADAAQPDHACAVTLFLQGVEAATAALVLLAAPLRRVLGAVREPAPVRAAVPAYRLPPGRGPPRD